MLAEDLHKYKNAIYLSLNHTLGGAFCIDGKIFPGQNQKAGEKYARKGSVIVLVAVFAGMAEIDLAVANDHELDIKSTIMYRHDDYLKAYQYIDDNRETTMKVIINVQEHSERRGEDNISPLYQSLASKQEQPSGKCKPAE